MNKLHLKAMNSISNNTDLEVLNHICVKNGFCIKTNLEETLVIENGIINDGLYTVSFDKLIPSSLPVSDFPISNTFENPPYTSAEPFVVSIDINTLKTLSKVSDSSLNPKRKFIGKIFFDFENQMLVNTDGYGLTRLPFTHSAPPEIVFSRNTSVSIFRLLKIMNILKFKRIVKIKLIYLENKVSLMTFYFDYLDESVTYTFHCDDQNYVNYLSVIPTAPPTFSIDFLPLKNTNLSNTNWKKIKIELIKIFDHNKTIHLSWKTNDPELDFYVNTNIPVPDQFVPVIVNPQLLFKGINNFDTKFNYLKGTFFNKQFVFLIIDSKEENPFPNESDLKNYEKLELTRIG